MIAYSVDCGHLEIRAYALGLWNKRELSKSDFAPRFGTIRIRLELEIYPIFSRVFFSKVISLQSLTLFSQQSVPRQMVE